MIVVVVVLLPFVVSQSSRDAVFGVKNQRVLEFIPRGRKTDQRIVSLTVFCVHVDEWSDVFIFVTSIEVKTDNAFNRWAVIS